MHIYVRVRESEGLLCVRKRSPCKTGRQVDWRPYTTQRNVPKVHWSSHPSLVLSPPLPTFLSLPPSLPPSLPATLPLSSVSSMSRPLLYLPLASHCRALRKAQTASDKVRMICEPLCVGPEPHRRVRLDHIHCVSL